MKEKLLWLLKALLSGLIAVIVMTGFCSLYYNLPVHHDTEDGATDYAWESHAFYSRGTEGFAWGRTNNEGYLNSYDYTEDMPVDILVMGSSHMEAYNVSMDESTASVLGSLLPDRTVYNIGVSGHNFMTCADNIAAAVDKYQPDEYVVLEISGLRYSEEDLRAIIDGTVAHQESHQDGIVGLLQKNSFFRLLYAQWQGFADNAKATDASDVADSSFQKMADEDTYDAVLTKLYNAAAKYGAKLILVYHPHIQPEANGGVTVLDDAEYRPFFAQVCRNNKAEFLDMSDIFVENYRQQHVLPHGFSNTSVGAGHLNKYGHAMIAEAICDRIEEGN